MSGTINQHNIQTLVRTISERTSYTILC